MKAKVKSYINGKPITVIEVYPTKINGQPTIPFARYFKSVGDGAIYKDSELDFNIDSPHPEATISGWVAVDDFDNTYIYHSKPTQRCREFCDTGDYITYWDCDTKYPNGKRCYVIDKDLFPDLTPDSDPIEVEIVIKPKKQ